MTIDAIRLGEAIKEVRTARGMTQVQLAKKAGLSASGNSVALIERGERSVSIESLNALAGALDIPSACLTVLGSKRIGGGEEASAFMESLQKLITSTLLAQAQLRIENKSDKAKRAYVSGIEKTVADIEANWKSVSQKKKAKRHAPAANKRKKPSRKQPVH